MSQKELNKFKSERTQIRRLFTTQANKFEEIIKSGNYGTLGEEFSKLADKAERLFKLDEQVRELVFSIELSEEEITQEFDQVETYRDRWIMLVNKRKDKIKTGEDEKTNIKLSSESGSTLGYKCYKYPKLQFSSYNGDIKQWLNFWSQFKKIHENPEMDLDLKFHYLVQATVEGSPARALISSFPPCGENYDDAIELMKQRFGREDLLIEMYVRELLSLVLQNASSKINSLSTLYDRLQTQLRALSTLGVTAEKYACMLLPLVESSLPEDILREWERKRVRENAKEPMNELLEFLRKEVESEERITLAKTSLTNENKPSSKEKKKNPILENKSNIATATDLVNIKSQQKKCCIFCDGRHQSENCFKAHALSLSELLEIVKAKGHCFKCLRKGHLAAQCKAMLKCIICGSKHLPILCPNHKKPENNLSNNEGVEQIEHVEQNLANTNFTKVLMQTLHVTLKGNVEENVRVLIDTGSQRSYITKNMAYKLGYPEIRQETLVHSLFGGINSENKKHSCYKVRVRSTDKIYGCNFEVLDSEVICHSVPAVHRGPWVQELKDKGIILSDMSEGPIDLLIGADVAGKIMTGRKVELKSGLVALETKLGWTIMGKTSENDYELINNSVFNMTMNLFCTDESVTQLWRLDTIGIGDPSQTKTKEELSAAVRKRFLETTHILPDGRYEVRLPWIEGHPPLPTNYELAHKRLVKTVNKLEAMDKFRAYSEVFAEWLQDNIIEEVPTELWDVGGHYLPHRPVFKENSTTKIRPVFDASAYEKGYPSLNQCVEKGQNLIELIPSILLRFRLQRIGVVADIKKAFLQISVHKEDRDFLRFLNIASDGKTRRYRHTRVVFGVASSPFLLGAVMDFHLEQCEERVRNGTARYHENIVRKLRRSFYVDNCVTSVVDEQKLQEFVQQSTSILEEARFELRGWEWTDPLSTEIDINTGVLGLTWDRKRDKLRLNSNPIKVPERLTRRSLLSAVQRLFDPIGFCTPATLIPKLFIQETWVKGGDWDEEVDEEIKKKFLKWMEEVQFLKEVDIDRWFYGVGNNNANLTLHVFCDASQLAYAAAVFLRVEIEGKVYINLVEAKSRVSPIHRVTIPRLELLAATIGVRMGNRILEEIYDIPVFYWSDSSTTLSWIKREEPWGVFVFNRVSEIRRLTARETWHHVPGTKNPADLLSRGCSPKALLLSKWWEGPEWLRSPREDWPIVDTQPDENEVMAEIKKKAVTAVDLPDLAHSFTNIFSRYFSSYTKMVREVAWVYRFIMKTSKNVRPNFSRENLHGELSKEECSEAEKYLWKRIQEETFTGVEDKLIRRLKPQIDSNGLIRMRTKIWARKDTADFRAPIILLGNHVIVERLIYETHIRNSHVVGQTLLNLLREKFWIISGRQAVRRVVTECKRCLRFSARKLECIPPPLPEDRVRDAHIFEVIGIDLAGPLYLRDGKKVWVTLFTCAIYRAVHLDIVSSLSTEDFLLVLRRFIARRGRPAIIYTDNGTNFKGSSNALKDVDWQKITSSGTVTPIEWRFNPPSAPWWGGFFERLIGMMKVLLKKNLGRACLKQEELYTIICECEAMMNARPITYVAEGDTDLVPITPRMFLGEITEAGVPDLEELDAVAFGRRLKYRRRIKEELRKRFRAEYLGQLACFAKDPRNTRKPVVGEVVLIGSDNRKRLDWPLAVVEGLVSGKDGRCRLIQLRTAEGRLTRPLQRVYPLEVFSNLGEEPKSDQNLSDDTAEDSLPPEPDISHQPENKYCDTRTRCGRKVRLPVRFQ